MQSSACTAVSFIHSNLWIHELQAPSSTIADTLVVQIGLQTCLISILIVQSSCNSAIICLYRGTDRELDKLSTGAWHCTHDPLIKGSIFCKLLRKKIINADFLLAKMCIYNFFTQKWTSPFKKCSIMTVFHTMQHGPFLVVQTKYMHCTCKIQIHRTHFCYDLTGIYLANFRLNA